MVDLGAISLPVKPFLCKTMMIAHVSLQVTMIDRGRTMIPSTTLLLKLPVCYSNSISMTEPCPDMSAGPFVAWLKCSGNVFWGFSSFAWQRGTLQLIAIYLVTLHNILEYMQITIIQTEAADFVKINSCFILKSFGHDCTYIFQLYF
jgi:hypothetical protein